MKANLKAVPATMLSGVPAGKNVRYSVRGDVLVIEVDISADTLCQAEPSKTGKSRIVASTSGFAKASDSVSFASNVITK